MSDGTPYWCYVLWSPVGDRFYIGVTDALQRRLRDHNTGVSRWTKRYAGTWELAWQRQFASLEEARTFENLLKRQKGGDGFFSLTDLRPTDFRSSGS